MQPFHGIHDVRERILNRPAARLVPRVVDLAIRRAEGREMLAGGDAHVQHRAQFARCFRNSRAPGIHGMR